MATFDANFHPKAFEHMENRRKTVYAVIANDEYRFISSGDRLEFGDFASITVGAVRRYTSLEHLVEVEGWQALVPEATSADEAVGTVRSVPEWDSDAEQKHGILALRVRETHRKERMEGV